MNSLYTRMVIGECLSEEQINEYARLSHEFEEILAKEPGFHSARLLIEEDGNMAVMTTTFATREDCLRHHSSRSYRQFVQQTQHLLAGNFVVKLFREDRA